jgi:hypothetical protein
MANDPILEETRRAREAYAAQFGGDLEAMARDLREQTRRSGRATIALAPRRPRRGGGRAGCRRWWRR